MPFTFAKHETFYIRDGWINKGIQAIQDNPHIFLENHAPEQLGLGKNMVRALRYWTQASGIAKEGPIDRRPRQALTRFGKLLWDYDPYQEMDGTLWFLHHNLISNHELTTAWYWFFNHYVPTRFTLREFLDRLKTWLNTQVAEESKNVADSSLRKDFDCLLKHICQIPATHRLKMCLSLRSLRLVCYQHIQMLTTRRAKRSRSIGLKLARLIAFILW